ncbi:multicopper oxidase family protein [Microbispora triticiradicis]|uniref:multicopper oxidase family protein n=1 Tax=Microbispora triticiradicis TaxID=2200763 RepID=UPI001AD6FDD3|nr:multicopper oxidase family protein [Microbispora triticiradicis]MBO4274480.1 multicopper oxidase domain-containing protein [Microbispora triticiradicis]
MTTDRLMVLDLLVSVLAAAAWVGAGAAAAARRPRTAAALMAGALVASPARAGSVLALAGAGWWFVQEKVTIALPLLLTASVVAAVTAGPRLLAASRAASEAGRDAARSPAVVVPLLGAGYAAAAGPVQTFLLGYPAEPGSALILLAVVAGAVLLTWRAMTPRVPLLRAATAATAVAALAGGVLTFIPATTAAAATPVAAEAATPGAVALAAAEGGHDMPGHGMSAQASAPVRPVTDLRGPSAPAPGGTVRRFTLTARTATVTLSSGRKVAAWTFDGQVPGPPITAEQGDLVEVRLRNADITEGVTLHWHGYDVPSGEDGVPGLTQEAVPPGGEFVYRFVAAQTGTYWYHTHEVSDIGVRMGLYGMLVVKPRGSATTGVDLTLPVHTFAGTTVVGDHDQPVLQEVAPGTPVRLRLVDTDNTPHRFTLAGTVYRLVAVDGTDLSGPGPLSRAGLRLPAGGRYDLAFAMPSGPVVLRVDDRTEAVRLTTAADGPGNGPGTGDVTDAEDAAAAAGWPELDLTRYGTPASTPYTSRSHFDRRFTLVLDRGLALGDGLPIYAHTINGRAYPHVPTQVVAEGDLVRLTVVNRGRETHPWHLHGHRVLVLARDGRAPTGSPLWLDTFDVRPGEVWEVAFRAANPGLWMNHCHNLSHADLGMMLHLAYEGVTTPFHGGHGG